MQTNLLITVLFFCFLSDSPLDSHVNRSTCTWFRLRSAAPCKLSPPIPKVGSLYLSGFGQRHTLSVTRDIVLLSANCEPVLHGCSELRCFKDVIASRQTASVLLLNIFRSLNINLTSGQVFSGCPA